MKEKTDYNCPKCKSTVTVWADLDAELSFEVSKEGKPKRRVIKNSRQSDARAGVRCTQCSWSMYADDISQGDQFLPLIDKALAKQDAISFLKPSSD